MSSNLAQFEAREATHLGLPLTPAAFEPEAISAVRPFSYWKSATQFARSALPLALADVIALCGSTWLLLAAMEWLGWQAHAEPARYLLLLATSLAMTFTLFGLYPGIGLHPIVELRLTSIGITVVWGVNLTATLLNAAADRHTALALMAAWPLWLVSIPLARAMARRLCSRFDWWRQPALVVGSGPTATEVYTALKTNRRLGLRPVARLHAEAADMPGLLRQATALKSDAGRGNTTISWAVIAMPERGREGLLRAVDRCSGYFPNLLIVPDVKGLPTLWTSAHDFGGMPGLKVQDRLLAPGPQLAKWLLDMSLTITGGLVVLPLIACIACLVRLSSRGPAFYAQERIGRGGRRFRAWKFRTMACDADRVLKEVLDRDPALRAEWDRDHKLRHDPRVTRVGRWLRKTSLDELPQIYNVLRGEMSLVGPRPIVDAEIVKYGEHFNLYAKVRPGISGLWQVSGRNDTSYRQRVELDTFYVRNWSPWLDLYVLGATARVVLFREGAY